MFQTPQPIAKLGDDEEELIFDDSSVILAHEKNYDKI